MDASIKKLLETFPDIDFDIGACRITAGREEVH